MKRYHVVPKDLDILHNCSVHAHLILIGSFGDETKNLASTIPNERAHVCFSTSLLGFYAEVPVLVDVNTNDIENIVSEYPGYFTAVNDTVVLKFCVMSKLGESTIYNSTSETNVTTAISYSKVKVQVEIDMKKGFESASVAVTEESPEEEVAESTVDYERKCIVLL